MDETRMQHGSDWRGEDVAGWWLSEKLDGCRVYWDGASLWSRGGLDLAIPEAWRRELPAGIALDGELYDGVGGVYRCGAAIRYGRFLPSMRFMVFDAPRVAGDWPRRMRQLPRLSTGAR